MPTNDTNISAKIIADSVNKFGNRLTTFVITYPRIILAEVNTHRMLSRSTASSRAIPVSRQIDKVRSRPFIPSWIGKNQSGMQAKEEIELEGQKSFKSNWLMAAGAMCNVAGVLEKSNIHKQISNRLLEPFGYVTSIVSGTDFANFFKLRCHPDAQPEFMILAFRMLEEYVHHKPTRSDSHVPFGDRMPYGLTEDEKVKIACARCARVSYETHDGSKDPSKDIELYNRLISAGHMSPFEHVAKAHINDTYVGNFRGWVQERKKIQGENINNINYEKLLEKKPTWV